MEPEGSLPHPQLPTIWSCPEPTRSSPYPHIHFLKIHLNIILPSKPGSSKWSLSLKFPHQNPVYASTLSICATCAANLLLDLITRTILGEQYRSLSSSLCSFLHSLLPRPFQTQIFSSAPYSQTLPPTFVLQFQRPSFIPGILLSSSL